jgi:hypothetical protein
MISGEALMDFRKFAQSKKGLMYSDETIFIEGIYKTADGEIQDGDNFKAHKVWKSGEKVDVELVYKTYLEWFNYTLRPGERERFFVSVKLKQEQEK